ncbi:hypothetical protein ACFX13_038172 [Malus domestica]
MADKTYVMFMWKSLGPGTSPSLPPMWFINPSNQACASSGNINSDTASSIVMPKFCTCTRLSQSVSTNNGEGIPLSGEIVLKQLGSGLHLSVGIITISAELFLGFYIFQGEGSVAHGLLPL